MRKLFSLCAIVALFMMVGCATLLDFVGQTHYKTFELTIDEQKVIVNLPSGLPPMDKAVLAYEECFNVKVCRQRFCLSEDLGHDHVDFVYIETDVIALVWARANKTEFEKAFVAWVYIEQKPVSVPISRISDLVKEHDPNQ